MEGGMKTFERTKQESERHLTVLRAEAKALFGESSDLIIGVNGSLARREFTSGSDLDLFYLTRKDERDIQEAMNQFTNLIQKLGFKPPAAGGVFDAPLPTSTLIRNIGGRDDTNETITRRMLFLLEGEWLFGEQKFVETRQAVIEAYAHDKLRAEQICLFLLNDIIRYWRTICIDFEFKVRAGDKAKAIRLIKLRFSRMLIYVAGVLAIGETHNKPADEKRTYLAEIFGHPPVERIKQIAAGKAADVLARYDKFLESIDDATIRTELDVVGEAGEATNTFKKLNREAHDFREAVAAMIEGLYPRPHPLQRALMY